MSDDAAGSVLERFAFARALQRAGLYKWRPLVTSVVNMAGVLTVLAALQPGILPDALDVYHAQIVQIGKWAIVVVGVCGVILPQTSKKVLPNLPDSEDDA